MAEGIGEIDATLEHRQTIESFGAKRPRAMLWIAFRNRGVVSSPVFPFASFGLHMECHLDGTVGKIGNLNGRTGAVGSLGNGAGTYGDMREMTDHPSRYVVTNELHARPFADLTAPEHASHFAMLMRPDEARRERDHLEALCKRYNVAPPQPDATHFTADFGAFRLKWERHTEFTTYTFFRRGQIADLFGDTAAAVVPKDWLDALPGQRMVASHLALLGGDDATAASDSLTRYFVMESFCRGSMLGGEAIVSTDFRIHADGFTRTLVQDVGMTSRESGRLIQRLLEIETYWTMAMLALPLAREVSPGVGKIGEALVDLTARMNTLESIEDERDLLAQLTSVSAEIEKSIAATSYRFGAARAYLALVEERIAEVREKSDGQYSTLSAFIDRRLAPAMRTCESVATRQLSLSARATRAANLLRTRVDIKVEGQNRDLLASMDRRARLQLRLQRIVEGLSVAAITYYVVSLIGYSLDAAVSAGAVLDTDLLRGLSIPVAAVLIWLGSRQIRKQLEKESE